MALELSYRKMSAVFFVFTLVIAYVAAYLPPYIHPCGLKDPNYNQCIINNIDDIKDKICTGMPELNISPLEPLIINNLPIFNATNTKLNFRRIEIYGFCDLVVNSVYTDPDKHHFNFDFNVKQVRVNITYDFDIRLLTQIAHKGIIYIIMDNTGLKVGLDLKTITKNSNKYVYASKMNSNIDIRNLNYEFDEKEQTDFRKIINDIINTNGKDIIRQVKPSMEKEISKRTISLLNDIFRYTSYEELFPEKVRIV